LKAYHPSRT